MLARGLTKENLYLDKTVHTRCCLTKIDALESIGQWKQSRALGQITIYLLSKVMWHLLCNIVFGFFRHSALENWLGPRLF